MKSLSLLGLPIPLTKPILPSSVSLLSNYYGVFTAIFVCSWLTVWGKGIVLSRTVVGWDLCRRTTRVEVVFRARRYHFNSEEDFHTGCRNVSRNQQQSSSGLHQPGQSTNYKHWLTWVTTNNSPSQDYTSPDDQPTTNIDSPESQPTTVLRTAPTWSIN